MPMVGHIADLGVVIGHEFREAILLAEASGPLSRRDYQALRPLSGVAPVTKQSGKSRVVVRRYAAHVRLRDESGSIPSSGYLAGKINFAACCFGSIASAGCTTPSKRWPIQ